MSTPEAKPCPACGSDSNERDELTKAEREIERLTALAGPSGKRLGELERINDDLIADNERLAAALDEARASMQVAYLALNRVTAERDALREALRKAIRQGEHDMLPTGEELREWRAALAQGKEPSNG